MKYKKGLIFICLLIFLFSIASVCASDVNDAAIAKDNTDQVVEEVNDDVSEVDEEILSSSDEDIIEASDDGTFSVLYNRIYSTQSREIMKLENNYEYNIEFGNSQLKITKPITIDGDGYKINAKGQTSIFIIECDNVTIKNVVFKNAKREQGGAIFSKYNTTIIDCTFINCSAEDDGGAILIDNGNINNCTFIKCFAEEFGGGVTLRKEATVINCKFIDCYAGARSGAVHIPSEVHTSVINSTFTNCYCERKYDVALDSGDGAICAPFGNPNICNCKFINSSCQIYDGNITNCNFLNCDSGIALYVKDCNVTNCKLINCSKLALYVYSDVYLNNCDFINCSGPGPYGGVIDMSNGGNIVNSRFINCFSEDKGAIYIQGGIIINCSFVNCYSKLGGALYCYLEGPDIISCNFTNCSASEYGGAIYNEDINNKYNTQFKGCNIYSCIFNNCSSIPAYAICNPNGTCIAINSIFSDLTEIEAGYNVNFINCTFKKKADKTQARIIANDITMVKGEGKITVTLESYDGTALKKKTIQFTIGDFVANSTTNALGKATVLLNSLNVGSHVATITFAGDENYEEVSKDVIINVTENSVTPKPDTNTTNTTSGNTSDTNMTTPEVVIPPLDTPSEDGTVEVKLPSDATGTVILTVNNKNYTFNVKNGIANVKLPELGEGNYNYTIKYSGDSKYSSFTTNGKLNVNNTNINPIENTTNTTGNETNTTKPTPEIVVPPLDKPSEDGSVTISLPNDATGKVTLTINGKSYNYLVENGVANIIIPNLGDGNYPYTITYSGDSKYSSFTNNGSLKVDKTSVNPIENQTNSTVNPIENQTNTTGNNTAQENTPAVDNSKIVASNVNVVYFAGSYYTIKVYGTDGKLANCAVKISGKISKSLTAKKGIAKFMVTQAPGTYKIKITALGKSVTKTITVQKATPKLTAKAKAFKKKVKTKKYTVTLKTNQNKVMKNTKLTLKVNGKTYSATTNAKGQATFKITKLTKKGKFTATIKYAGSKYYNAKTVTAKITVK